MTASRTGDSINVTLQPARRAHLKVIDVDIVGLHLTAMRDVVEGEPLPSPGECETISGTRPPRDIRIPTRPTLNQSPW
jgi:hypothetical protein